MSSPPDLAAAPLPRRVLLLDCDMFFVQVAKLEDPDGVGRADLVVVGGRPGERGVVASASYGARAFGVHSAMPMSTALRLCPNAVVVPVPRDACGRLHREIRSTLERFTPVVEAASIDEFYLDLTGTERLYGGEALTATARRIQQAVREETRIAVSLGGGTQRLIAKLATELAKPGGVHVVPAGAEAEFMLRFDLADLPGVGPVLADTLQRRGLRTVREALPYDEASLCLWLGETRGRWLYRRVRGIDSAAVEPRADAKSISHERTFAEDIYSLDELEGRLLPLVVELGADLRRGHLRARTVTAYVRDRDFRDRQVSRTLAEPLESYRAIAHVARTLLREIWARRQIGVRLLGVRLSNLAPCGAPEQMWLLDTAAPVETERDRSLAHAADRVRERFGKEALLPARMVRERDEPE
ncbi:DNA polymerase IV [soil metagenome]